MSLLKKLSNKMRGMQGIVPVHSIAMRPTSLQALTPRPSRQPMGSPEQDKLLITCPDPTGEDLLREAHIKSGQKLARQERWIQLATKIERADMALTLSPGGMPVADLMAYGARADVVLAVEHALINGHPERGAPLVEGVEALEHVLAEHHGNHIIAAIVAQTHMDIGWAWRGTGWDVEVPGRNREAFEAHFDRAAAIFGDIRAQNHASPLVAATCCALLGAATKHDRRAADRYERLIDLNPHNPRPMRALGNHLLPRWFGSYAELELEARRTAARTMDVWGAGGYTWVMFDAIKMDDQACANLDLEFFVEGLHDILARCPDPYIINLLAAFCANALGQSFSGNDEADNNRAQIAECARWIVREHLTELHPMIWAHAAQGFDNNLRIQSRARFAASGLDDATRVITGCFSREIAEGRSIVFKNTGPDARAVHS